MIDLIWKALLKRTVISPNEEKISFTVFRIRQLQNEYEISCQYNVDSRFCNKVTAQAIYFSSRYSYWVFVKAVTVKHQHWNSETGCMRSSIQQRNFMQNFTALFYNYLYTYENLRSLEVKLEAWPSRSGRKWNTWKCIGSLLKVTRS